MYNKGKGHYLIIFRINAHTAARTIVLEHTIKKVFIL